MDDSKKDISQIKKYLQGELDARAMHQLEREAQDDPFLMDAMEGFEVNGADAFNLDELDARLQQRIAPAKVRSITPWRYYAAAAAVLLFFSIGYMMWPKGQEAEKKQVADLVTPATPDRTAVPVDTTSKTLANEAAIAVEKQVKETPVLANKVTVDKEVQESRVMAEAPAAETQQAQIASANVAKARMAPVSALGAVMKADTQVYYTDAKQVSADKRYPKGKLDSILKNINGYVVDKNGNIVTRKSTDSILAAALVNNKNDNVGNIGRADANTVVRGYVRRDKKDTIDSKLAYYSSNSSVKTPAKKDSTVLREITIPGLPKLTDKNANYGSTQQPRTLPGKVKDADYATPPKASSLLVNELGAPISPNLAVAAKKEAQENSLGKFNSPVSAHAGMSDRAKEAQEKNASATLAGYEKLKDDKVTIAYPKMGQDAYDKYLKAKAIAAKAGTVRVSFTVDAKGQLSDFKILKSLNDAIDKKAIDLIKNGPAWAGDISGKTTTVVQKVVFSKE